MSRTVNKFAVLLALLMIVELSTCALTRRRRDDDDEGDGGITGFIEMIQGWMDMIPILGGPISGAIGMGLDAWNKAEDMTNGGIGRIMGGAFPCTVTETDILCQGVSSRSDASKMTESLLNLIPGLIAPGFMKSAVMVVMDAGVAPLIDILFGGVPKT